MRTFTIKEALLEASSLLKDMQRPYLEAQILLSFLLKKDRIDLVVNENKKLEKEKEYFELVKRRAEYEPLEYITNEVSFYSRKFYIKKGVLIPRPETELLIDHVLDIVKRYKKPPDIAEIGVGSGIISVIIALFTDDIKITATDISTEAIKCAKINAKKYKVQERISFVNRPYLDTVKQKFDIIISNPPYIADDFKLDKSVEKEPKEALYGGKTGDEMLKRIVKIAKEKEAKHLVCEMGYDQKESMEEFFKKEGIKEYFFYKDLASLDRGFVINFKEKSL